MLSNKAKVTDFVSCLGLGMEAAHTHSLPALFNSQRPGWVVSGLVIRPLGSQSSSHTSKELVGEGAS